MTEKNPALVQIRQLGGKRGGRHWVFPNETPEDAFCFLGVLLDNTRKPCMQSGIMTLSEQLGQSSAENNNEMLQSSV